MTVEGADADACPSRDLVQSRVDAVLRERLAGGDEVTGDPRYYNASLVRRPYSHWNEPGPG